MDFEGWGVGDKRDAPAFRTQLVGERESSWRRRPVELIFGEHPHSRSDNNIYARDEEGRIQGYSGHHVRRRVDIEEYNYQKSSGLSGDEIRKGCKARIYFNDELVYGFFCREVEWAMSRAAVLLVELMEHPIALWDPVEVRKMTGRKVFYRDQPGTLAAYTAEDGAVGIVPDGIEGFRRPAWDTESDHDGNFVRVDILSSDIWWFRGV